MGENNCESAVFTNNIPESDSISAEACVFLQSLDLMRSWEKIELWDLSVSHQTTLGLFIVKAELRVRLWTLK